MANNANYRGEARLDTNLACLPALFEGGKVRPPPWLSASFDTV